MRERRPGEERCAAATSLLPAEPNYFHHIETPGRLGRALHLHFLWPSLAHLPNRGIGRHGDRHCHALHGQAKILTPRCPVQRVKAMLKSGEVSPSFDGREEGEFSHRGPSPCSPTPMPPPPRAARPRARASPACPIPTALVRMDGGD